MRNIGFILTALGLIGLLAGMSMDTSVSSSVGSLNRVNNIGLMSQQSAWLTVSGFLFVAGCILIGFATLRDAIERLGSIMSAPASQVASSETQAMRSPPFPLKVGDISIGTRVHHRSLGAGIVEEIDGNTLKIRFDGREKPEPMNAAYLTLMP